MSSARSDVPVDRGDQPGECNPVLDILASPRAHRIAVAVALALAVALGAAILGGGGSDGPAGRLGGDYPAFYGASRMVLEGQGASLYDPEVQAAAQRDLMGTTSSEFVYYPYPPFYAGLLVPFAALGYRLSFMLWVLASVGMVAWSLRLLRPHVRLIDRAFVPVLVATVAFWPLLRGIIGGQNTALTMLLSVGAWWALREGRDLLAGALLAGLTYKPQFAGPLIALVLVVEVGRHRRWRIVGGLGGAGAALWGVGAWVNGWDWVWSWPRAVGDYPSIVARNDAANEVSFIGVARSIWGYGSPIALGFGGLLALGAAAALAALWWRRGSEASPRERLDPGLLGCTLATLMLLPPHSMFYDSGLALVALWFLADRATTTHGWRGDLAHGRPSPQLVAVVWLWGLVHLLAAAEVVTPLLLMCVVLAGPVGRVTWLKRSDDQARCDATLAVTTGR